jgi:hypothetical protein
MEILLIPTHESYLVSLTDGTFLKQICLCDFCVFDISWFFFQCKEEQKLCPKILTTTSDQ